MPRFETRQTEPGPRAQCRSHAPEHTFFFVFPETGRDWSPPLPTCGEKRAGLGAGGTSVCAHRRGWKGDKAASNLSQRGAICLGLSPAWELRIWDRVAQTGLAREV